MNARMRPITALAMPDVPPAEIDTARPVFREVPPASLLVDERYQRNLSERSVRLIRRIVGGWSWRAFKPPVVVEVDGALHVIDGQHTAIAAASHGGVETIPVMVVEAGEARQRAVAFVRHNRDRLNVTPMQLHHAMVEAGDEDALTIAQACERAGARILKTPPGQGRFDVGDTMAVGFIRGIVNRRHAKGARRVLEVCVKAMLAPIGANHLRAVEAILFEPEYAGAVEDEALAEAIRKLGSAAEDEAAMVAAAHKMRLWKGLVIVYFKHARKTRRAA